MRLATIILSFPLAILLGGYAIARQGPLPCRVHPEKGTPTTTLSSLATVSRADAQRTAVESLKASAPTTVEEGELEVEHGCLVYSFDIRVSGKEGTEEVLIDAGTGKVLSHTHESAEEETAEQEQEKASQEKR
jgi:hypothetical protein